MIDAVKDYLTPKTYSILAYVCLIAQFLSGLGFTAVVIALRTGEFGKFNCRVATESTAVKTDVEKTCYSEYEQTYNSTLPFYGFVLLSIWFPVIVAVIYSLAVRRRVEEIDSDHEAQTVDEANKTEQNASTQFYVFYCYFVHLVVRLVFGILITSLQRPVFFPNGFHFEFDCSLPTTASMITKNANTTQLNDTSTITCQNLTASEKNQCGVIVSVLNVIFAFIILVEVIRLFRRFPTFKLLVSWSSDIEFVTVYLLRKRYTRVSCIHLTTADGIDFYKQQVLNSPRPLDTSYGPKAGLDDLFVSVVIHTERAPHKFRENMDRHEIFDVYMTVPVHSILLKRVTDLFYPSKDTKGDIPRKILAIGRPGIGKTVLTEKIMRDWANGIDEFYRGKIAFYFKFRWFNFNELKNMTLKTFLRFGTRLSDEKFERIYEVTTNQPDKTLLIFDGLDEFHGDIMKCLDQLPPPDDLNTCMSEISLFIKLISGQFLQGATVLVTSRPTANELYSRFKFDRSVEIIGFTPDKIEEYVCKFCVNNNRSDLKAKIWNHIESSTDLINLSYIPVNCLIISSMLFGCLSDSSDETGALPTTVTELYQAAVDHFDKYHNRRVHGQSSEKAMEELQLLAYNGIENGQLVFNEELFDEEMKQSGLLNSISNPIFPVQTQFCFIHLTIQEFLAAKHVTERQGTEEIKEFISFYFESVKWQLVLQFIAGLLGKKMKMFSDKQRYKDCVKTFTSDGFEIYKGELNLSYSSVFVMRCLREVSDEEVAREACETTALKDVVRLNDKYVIGKLFSSDWAAVVFVCKYMTKLIELTVVSRECSLEVCKLLRLRCIQQLDLCGSSRMLDDYVAVKPVFKALMSSKSSLNLKHSELTKLVLEYFHITDECSSTICEFFKNGHGRCLELLKMNNCQVTPRGVSIFCEVLDNKLCPELTSLDLSNDKIRDAGVRVLCDALISQVKLTKLLLDSCLLTDQCIPSLCKLLNDGRCKLTVLSLSHNEGIGDIGVRVLCGTVLTKEHCTLVELRLRSCSLTNKCISSLCELLNDIRCQLTVLSLAGNKDIGDEGVRMLCVNVLTQQCKLVKLDLGWCSLTDECIPELCKALLDEHCVLSTLLLHGNNLTEKGVKLLCEVETHKDCKFRGLKVLPYFLG